MNWQPIETAPRADSQRVLLCRTWAAENMAVGWWNDLWDEWIAVNGDTFINPTHWMPLPEPPK